MKRRSVYQAGSQQQENMILDYEANATFLPDVESTRLMQNTIVSIENTLPLSTSEVASNKSSKLGRTMAEFWLGGGIILVKDH